MREKKSPELDHQFTDRWSPRAFLSDPIEKSEIDAFLEAAHWSPSCFNEQPWYFVYATSKEKRKAICETLAPANQAWAAKAPLLLAIFSKTTFEKNGNDNRWADFDTGAAWMSLSLQALKRGFYCHAMGGYSEEKIYEVTQLDPSSYRSLAVIAVGRKGPPTDLPKELQDREIPSPRKPVSEISKEL